MAANQATGVPGGSGIPSAAELNDPAFWAALCPELTVMTPSNESMETVSHKPFNYSERPDVTEDLKTRMKRDGYFEVGSSDLPWSVDVAKVAEGAKNLLKAGLPASFLLAYVEPWLMTAQLEALYFRDPPMP